MKQSIYCKYPDLLRLDNDATMTQLVDDLDKLSRQPEVPQELVDLSIFKSLVAREAESYAVPLPKTQTLRGLTRPSRTLQLWSSRWLVVLIFGLILCLTALYLFLNQPPNNVYVGEPNAACVNSGAAPTIQVDGRTFQLGCHTINIPQVQVDNERIIISYLISFSGMPTANFKPFSLRLLDENGRELKRLGSLSSGQVDIQNAATQNGIPVSYNMSAGANGGEIWFDSSSFNGLAANSQIKLRLEIGGFSLYSSSRNYPYQPSVIQGPFKFDLTATYQNFAQVSELNLSDTVSNQTVTLEKVVRRPDMTRFYLRGLGNSFNFDLNAAGFYLGGTNDPSSPNISNTSQIFTGDDGVTIIQINNSLQERQGEWRLILRPASAIQPNYDSRNQPQVVTGGPWFFHFQLPGAG